MYGYVYAPAAPWSQGKCELKQKAATSGKSIAEKHEEIVRQFQQIANTKAQLGLSSESITRLESAFASTYKKATSGYWGGGLWDGFYRYTSNPSRQGLYFLMGEQLHDRDIDSLTPSARRFSMILGHLADALRKEEEILRKCGEMVERSTALRSATFEDADAQRAEYTKIGAECMDVLAEVEQCLNAARETIRCGSKEVWPERKHFGKRFAMSAVLYCIAGGLAIAALIASSGTLAIVGVVLAIVIRVVSLGSIRGFDRERGWKSVESLLASTKQLIETEGATMKTYLDISDRRAALAREDMMWNLLQDVRTQTQGTDARVSAMAEQMSGVVSSVDSLRGDVRALQGTVDALQSDVGRQSQALNTTQETLVSGFSGVERKLDDFRSDLQRLSRLQEVTSMRSAMVALSTFPTGDASYRNRQMPERANSWSPYTHAGARMA
ncbi:hypothetical protein PCO31111_04830 [Pandoraea communis]|uniref:Uncharacterized protein n=1 Tax=Pandoraea communis TaxID=2508297 RepID=A0A5E4YV33_9BURK|nr:hypothetical protein PCO31111_04830 [Pandoraea communis]